LGEVRGLAPETSYGLPSGHASGALAAWGGLATLLARRWLWWLAGPLIGLISLSRLYLGVHFLSDVVVGWLLAAAVIGLVLAVTPLGRRLLGWPVAGQLILVGLAALVILLIGWLRLLALERAVDGSWPPLPGSNISLEPQITLSGALFGASVGLLLAQRLALGRPSHHWRHWVPALALGLIGLVVFWRGLALPFEALARLSEGPGLHDALRWLRYALVGGWVAVGAPWLWRQLGWAQPAGSRR
jgi:hypothetical protein